MKIESGSKDRGFFKVPQVRTSECEKTRLLSEKRRREWIALARINWPVTTDPDKYRVCSRHFISVASVDIPAGITMDEEPAVPAFELCHADVAAIHRLPCKFGKTPGIIVRYVRQSVRDEWLHNRSKLREKKSSLFIQENLTSQSRQLLREAKEWARENRYKYAWHKNGKILLRKSDGDSVLVVRHRTDFPV
ncbi:hypothetical protein HPB51_015774 [Rhipicephalus microplus]|uniref:THAP-type domain-containing protein n=1 Tax=Rhipicephalus microplus TaxID=6941 RepID=A0A9J6EH80_RHIMP|nr:hypothetical protein HPB51_015774 [Rhipicephalus microplus]